LLEQAEELRYLVLHEPFGVARDDCWDDGDPASSHVVALADGRVVGYARLIAEAGEPSPQIRQVAVEPAWERRGIGSALVQALVEQARSEGRASVWLNARVTALPFYERLGFEVTSEVFRTPRTYLPHRRMELGL
jgi:GNAT superfamily N-acetyltransferase